VAVCLIQDLVMKTVGALTAAQLALLPLSGEHVAKLLMLFCERQSYSASCDL
jgi:hypothetical protein